MTGLHAALAGGALTAFGLVLAVWAARPGEPDLADALARLAPAPARRRTTDAAQPVLDRKGRAGAWAARALPTQVWVGTPIRELALLGIPVATFYGEKLLFAALGLAAPPLLGLLLTVLGWDVPLTFPAGASLGLAVGLFMVPNLNARDDAAKARAEFTRALSAYVDLVALERNAGSGPRQAMEAAAAVGDTWVFHRLSEELARSRWSGHAPWDALHDLADELGLPELDDLADIMRLSGEEGAAVYATLRARAAGIRAALLSTDLARANETGERLSIPMSLLGVIFMAILVTPALLRVTGS